MDPRPYNYEFRRPRLSNPTYQSYNAYDSLYHMGKKEYINPIYSREQIYQPTHQYSPGYYSPYNYQSNGNHLNSREGGSSRGTPPRRYEETGVNTDNKQSRGSSNYSQRSKSSNLSSGPRENIHTNPTTHRTSVLSTYGSSSLERKEAQIPSKRENINIVFTHDNTSQVFKKQQRPFNIITMYSKETEPLRKFPKLTREHLLYEQGMQFVKAD